VSELAEINAAEAAPQEFSHGILSPKFVACKYAGIADGEVSAPPTVRTMWPSSDDDRLLQFEEEGYCVLPSAISLDRVSELREEYARLAAGWKSTACVRDGYDLEPRQIGFDVTPTQDSSLNPEDVRRLEALSFPAFRKIGGVYDLSGAYRCLVHSPVIVDFMTKVIGSEVFLFRDLIYPHVARISREKPWHNDADYWVRDWNCVEKIVQTMTVIDPHRVEMGCLQVVPGSHRKDWEHIFDRERKVRPHHVPLDRAIGLELNPGDVVVFDCRLLHASQANASAHDRCVVYNAYCPPAVTFKGEGQPPELIPIAPHAEGSSP
jgi:phytanoyl-CoA hydroxylase